MENKQISKDFMVRLRAKFTQKYGMEMDEWFSALINEMDELNTGWKGQLDSVINEVRKTATMIKGQIKSVHFEDRKQAFWYGAGTTFPLSIVVAIGLIISAVLTFYNQEYQEKRDLINAYPNTNELRLFLENATIEKHDGRNYIPLKLAPKKRGSVSIGVDYEYDAKNKRVLIPLGTE